MQECFYLLLLLLDLDFNNLNIDYVRIGVVFAPPQSLILRYFVTPFLVPHLSLFPATPRISSRVKAYRYRVPLLQQKQ